MADLFPLSKSGLGNFEMCPWYAHALKNLGFQSPPSEATEIGIKKHWWVGEILQGNTSVEDMRVAEPPEIYEDVELALQQHDIPTNTAQLVEAYFALDINGQLVGTKPFQAPDTAVIHGYQDLIVVEWQDATIVKDWKFGNWEKDDPAERHMYVLGARAQFPEHNLFRFIRHFPRSGNQYLFAYEFEDDGTVKIWEHGKRSLKRLKGQPNGLVEWMQALVRRVQNTPPIPTPGRQCTSMYGHPCPFLGLECPATAGRLPAPIMSAFDKLESSEAFTVLRDLVAEPMVIKEGKEYSVITHDGRKISEGWTNKAKAQAWLKSDYLPSMLKEIPEDRVQWAFAGNQRLQEFCKRLEKRLKAWSEIHGDIIVGDIAYGWRPKAKNEVDTTYALRTMLENGVPVEAISRAVNISKTSINRLPNEYEDIKELLLEMAVTDGESKMEFGEIKEPKLT